MSEGWVVDGGFLYVRSLDDPSSHSWQVPRLATGVFMNGVSYVWIEGLEVRYYGEGTR